MGICYADMCSLTLDTRTETERLGLFVITQNGEKGEVDLLDRKLVYNNYIFNNMVFMSEFKKGPSCNKNTH